MVALASNQVAQTLEARSDLYDSSRVGPTSKRPKPSKLQAEQKAQATTSGVANQAAQATVVRAQPVAQVVVVGAQPIAQAVST